jgi:hypothetical protein
MFDSCRLISGEWINPNPGNRKQSRPARPTCGLPAAMGARLFVAIVETGKHGAAVTLFVFSL